MDPERRECGKCGSAMTPGVVAHRVNANFYPLVWIDGDPEPRKFLGYTGRNLNVSGKDKIELANYRCTGCGLIETYGVQ